MEFKAKDSRTHGIQTMIALGFKELIESEDREFVFYFMEQLETSIKKHYDTEDK